MFLSPHKRTSQPWHLETLTQDDMSKLVSEAEAGNRGAEYLLAEQGCVRAQTGMGEILIAGRHNGAIPDYADADRWRRMAATQGDADAQLWLGARLGTELVWRNRLS